MNRSGEAVAQALAALPSRRPRGRPAGGLRRRRPAARPPAPARARQQRRAQRPRRRARCASPARRSRACASASGARSSRATRWTGCSSPSRPEEEAVLGEALPRAADAVACFVADGIAAAMNRFNGPIDRVLSGDCPEYCSADLSGSNRLIGLAPDNLLSHGLPARTGAARRTGRLSICRSPGRSGRRWRTAPSRAGSGCRRSARSPSAST